MKTNIKLIMIVAVFLTAAVTNIASAADDLEIKAKFRKLTIERNNLYTELQELDKQAAAAMKDGKSTTQINSKQVTAQDKLDLLTLRLETMAVRYDFKLEPLPSEEELAQNTADDSGKIIDFPRGHDRTLEVLRKETLEMLASLNFNGFLTNQ